MKNLIDEILSVKEKWFIDFGFPDATVKALINSERESLTRAYKQGKLDGGSMKATAMLKMIAEAKKEAILATADRLKTVEIQGAEGYASKFNWTDEYYLGWNHCVKAIEEIKDQIKSELNGEEE